jgi:hypothetical protein
MNAAAEPGGQDVQPRLVDDADDLAEQHVDLAGRSPTTMVTQPNSDQGREQGMMTT